MSQENVEVVRKPLRANQRSRRTLELRLLLRFPRLTVAYLRLVGTLPPRSRLRQAALWRGMRQGVEAFNRRDLDVVTIAYDPDLEYYPYREFVEATLADRCYYGSSGYRTYIGAQNEVWGDDVRLEPTELIDLGDRLVLLADMPMRAQASGVPLAEKYAGVMTLRNGRVIRVDDFLNQTEALEAVGLAEAMSQENVEIVRKPLRVRRRSSRTLDERLLVRFPRLAAAYVPRVARLIDKLPPGSRLRQALLRRTMRGAIEAWNRRDLDVALIGQHPECEHRPPREFVEAGLWEPCYRGREGYRRLMAGWSDVGTHAQLEPTEFIDLGDRLVLLSSMSASSSHLGGVPLTRSYASVLALKDGRAISVTEYVDHAEALEAVGLRE